MPTMTLKGRSMWLTIIKTVLGFGGGIINKFQERKQKSDDARVAWETAAGRSMVDSWKDEFVTVVICWPLIQTFVGNLMFAFTGNSAILDAQARSMEEIGFLLETPYGDLMYIVVLAAVGIKSAKAFLR